MPEAARLMVIVDSQGTVKLSEDLKKMGVTVDRTAKDSSTAMNELGKGLDGMSEKFLGVSTSSLAAMGPIAAGFAAVGAGAAYVKDAVDQFQEYAFTVQEVSRLTGASAIETSKLIQVSDDLRIEAGDLQTALTAAARKGIDVSTESIARLSNEYLALAPGVERSKFLMDNFGKSGMSMAKLMEQGAAGIRSMSSAVEAGLVVNEQGIKDAEEYAAAIDALNDSFLAIKYTVGGFALPAITGYMKNSAAGTKLQNEQNNTWMNAVPILQGLAMGYYYFAGAQEVASQKATEANDAADGRRESIEQYTTGTRAAIDVTDLMSDAEAEHAYRVQQNREAIAAAIPTIEEITKARDAYNKKLEESVAASLKANQAQAQEGVSDINVAVGLKGAPVGKFVETALSGYGDFLAKAGGSTAGLEDLYLAFGKVRQGGLDFVKVQDQVYAAMANGTIPLSNQKAALEALGLQAQTGKVDFEALMLQFGTQGASAEEANRMIKKLGEEGFQQIAPAVAPAETAIQKMNTELKKNIDQTTLAEEGVKGYKKALMETWLWIQGHNLDAAASFSVNGGTPGTVLNDPRDATSSSGFKEGANGLDYIVPPGYPNDSFPVRAQSGERVIVQTAAQQREGPAKGFKITVIGDLHINTATPETFGGDLLSAIGAV